MPGSSGASWPQRETILWAQGMSRPVVIELAAVPLSSVARIQKVLRTTKKRCRMGTGAEHTIVGGCPRPKARLFASMVSPWPGSAQSYNTPETGEICGRPYDRVQVPGRPSEQGANLNES